MSRTIGPVAVIDLGTNTFNLLIIEQKNSVPKLLVSTKEGVALGMGGINTNQIASDAWQRGIECLQRFKEICVDYNCLKIKGIATSAIRNARNGSEFIREVESKLGIVCEVISGEREAELIYKGVCFTHNFVNAGLIMDIGGGSTEFIHADQRGIITMQSFEIGVSRIYQHFQFSDPFSKDDIESINAYLDHSTGKFFEAIKCDDFIGSSGSFETLYELLHDKPFPLGFSPMILTRNEMEVMIDMVLHMTNEEREMHHRILPIRRKMLPIAVAKIRWVMNKVNAKRVIITPCSLKEGVAFNLLNND